MIIAVLVVVVLSQVVFRYILHLGLPWADEVSRYLLIWVSFLGATVVFKNAGHAKVEFFRNMLPEKASQILQFVCKIISLVFLVDICLYSYNYFATSRSVTPAMQIPYSWPKSALFVGFALMLIHLSVFILSDVEKFLSKSK